MSLEIAMLIGWLGLGTGLATSDMFQGTGFPIASNILYTKDVITVSVGTHPRKFFGWLYHGSYNHIKSDQIAGN